MEQLIIILIFLAISFVNWLARQAEEKRAREALEEEMRQSPASPDDEIPEGDRLAPPKPQGRSTEEEQIRKFFEALGLPTEEIKPAPPPVAAPPPPPPPPRPAPQPAPRPAAAAQKTPDRPKTAVPQPKAQAKAASRESQLTKEEREALERIKAGKASAFPSARPSAKRARFRTGRAFIDETVALLHSPASARKAILLREILDRPVGLREPSVFGGPHAA